MGVRHVICLVLAASTLLAGGCGGSGGSATTGSNATTMPSVTIDWPAQSRDVQGPMSALSAGIIFRAAGASGQDVSMTVNRPISPGASNQTYTMTSPVQTGVHALDVVFFSTANGTGGEVADATVAVNVTTKGLLGPNGSALGTISFTSTITAVTVVPGQTIPLNLDVVPAVTAWSSGGPVVLTPGSATFYVQNNTGRAVSLGGSIGGSSPGTILVSATVDGLTSPLQSVLVQAPTTTALTPRIANLTTNELVYNPATGKLWASVPAGAGQYANCVVEIDPLTGKVSNRVSVGNQPDVLALSGDGTILYVAQDASSTVCPVNVVSHTAGMPFTLPVYSPGAAVNVSDMAVQPGNPNVVAVTTHDVRDSGFFGPYVFSDGKVLPNGLGIYQGWSIAFGSSTRLWALGDSEPNNIDEVQVNSSGATLVAKAEPMDGYDQFIRVFGGWLCGAGGAIADAATGMPIATLPVARGDTITVDTNAHKAYVFEYQGGTPQIGVFDMNTFTLVTVGTLPSSVTLSAPVGQFLSSDILRWGTTGLAFRTPTQIVLIDQAPGL